MPAMNSTRKRLYLDVNGIIELVRSHSAQRATLFTRLFQARPLKELRRAIDLFRAFQYPDSVQLLVEEMLQKQVSPDYHHMALCYIVRSYARMGMLHQAESIYAEIKRSDIPHSYVSMAGKLEEEVRVDLEECRSKFGSATRPSV